MMHGDNVFHKYALLLRQVFWINYESSPWWWRQYAPLKRRSTLTWQHGATFQKTLHFILATVRTWNLTQLESFKGNQLSKVLPESYCSWSWQNVTLWWKWRLIDTPCAIYSSHVVYFYLCRRSIWHSSSLTEQSHPCSPCVCCIDEIKRCRTPRVRFEWYIHKCVVHF
jgi:hypothetical protein